MMKKLIGSLESAASKVRQRGDGVVSGDSSGRDLNLIGDSLAGKSADDINAEIKRRNWEQFEKNDMPYIFDYANEITSGKHFDRAIDQARTSVNRGFSLAEAGQQRRDTGFGVSLSDAAKADRAGDMQRNKTAALIDAENNARLAAKDRENALLAGSHMPGGQ